MFKVPSLRNVALTEPYFHDGSAATLTDAIAKMAYHQLGKQLAEQDVAAIAAFLKSLTDKDRL
jgi:cytochrome c peroxidase